MATLSVRPWPQGEIDRWDAFVLRSNNGTLFHRLGFLAYHASKFAGHEHHIAFHNGSELFSVMPLGLFGEPQNIVARSPFGASYGGPVFLRPPTYAESLAVVRALVGYLTSVRATSLDMVLPIPQCCETSCNTFELALLECGGQCRNRDISSVVALARSADVMSTLTSRGRNMVRKAEKNGVSVVCPAPLDDFWKLMDITFARHGVQPTHTRAEWEDLQQRFPGHIYAAVAYHAGRPIAGVGYMLLNAKIASSFYFCSDPEYTHLQGLSLLLFRGMAELKDRGFRWLDFGTSSGQQKGNESIFRFKESLGSHGVFRDTYRLPVS